MCEFNKRTWAQIDLNAIKHNYELAVKLSGNKEVMPVIKANAYGHGAGKIGLYLEKLGVKHFAVAALDEAIELRNAGVTAQILILGATLPEYFEKVLQYDVIQTVASKEAAIKLNDVAAKLGVNAQVHIKVDTGMARIGFDARNEVAVKNAAKEISEVAKLSNLVLDGIYTHFATADIPDDEFALKQHRLFALLVDNIENNGIFIPHKHVSNSGDIINYPNNKYDMVREGIILYGYLPDKQSKPYDFKPAMTVYSVVSHISQIRKGETIGYGRTYIAEKDLTVAVIPIGYADGYPRSLSNKGEMLINGTLCKILGRVCMDQTMVDISGMDVKIGDLVTVLGVSPALTADDIADMTDTISYEVLCDISPRVVRTYVQE